MGLEDLSFFLVLYKCFMFYYSLKVSFHFSGKYRPRHIFDSSPYNKMLNKKWITKVRVLSLDINKNKISIMKMNSVFYSMHLYCHIHL